MERPIAYDPKQPHLGGNVIGGDENTYCTAVWDFLIAEFTPSSICDVGCGEGHLIEYFRRKGIVVTGIDGLPENKENAPRIVKESIIIHDYQKPQPDVKFYDMVVSCEFVEHVAEEFLNNYLEQFNNCETLVFTHAIPGQHGHNHVNCKDDLYWQDLLGINGFILLPSHTRYARELAGNSFWNTVLIFKSLKIR